MPRCRFVQPEVVRLALSDGDYLDVKKQLTAGEQRKAFTDQVKSMHLGDKAEIEPFRIGITRILAYVVGWSFVDQDGHPVPFSESAVNNLETDTYNEINDALNVHEELLEKEKVARKNEVSTSGSNPT